jgi:hypothetical protein
MDDPKLELNIALVDWLLEAAGPPPDGLAELATMGSGPLEEQDFDELLRRLGIQVYLPSEDSEVLVVGREGWSQRSLEQLLRERAGLQLRVYSQEMLFAYLAARKDPLIEDEDMVRAMAGDHPALRFLEGVGFRWPSTVVPAQGSGLFDADLVRVGYLKYTGYAVGKAGLTTSARRSILRRAYLETVPTVFPPHYVSDWGPPRSSKRLQKIADSIAMFCCNNKRRRRPSELAITQWESDLAWLKQEYYDGRYMFRWPATDVW